LICGEEKLNNGKEEKSCHGQRERGRAVPVRMRERERESERDLGKK